MTNFNIIKTIDYGFLVIYRALKNILSFLWRNFLAIFGFWVRFRGKKKGFSAKKRKLAHGHKIILLELR